MGTSATGAQIGEWVQAAAVIIGFAWVILQIVNSTRRKPSIEAEFATKQECRDCRLSNAQALDRLQSRVVGAIDRSEFEAFKNAVMLQLGETQGAIDSNGKALIQAISDLKSELGVQDERRAAALHSRINDHATEIARLKERTERTNH